MLVNKWNIKQIFSLFAFSFAIIHAYPALSQATWEPANPKQNKAPQTTKRTYKPTSVIGLKPINKGLSKEQLALKLDETIRILKINKCASRIKLLLLGIAANDNAFYSIEPFEINPDNGMIVISIESYNDQNSSRYTIISLSPDCSGNYVQTINWTLPCIDVKNNYFQNWKSNGPLMERINIYQSSPSLSVALMPSSTGCVSIKKELFRK